MQANDLVRLRHMLDSGREAVSYAQGRHVRLLLAAAPGSADGPEPVRRTGSGLPGWRLDRRPDKMLAAEWLRHCGIGVLGRID